MTDDSKLTVCMLSATAGYLIPLFNLCQTMSDVCVYISLAFVQTCIRIYIVLRVWRARGSISVDPLNIHSNLLCPYLPSF